MRDLTVFFWHLFNFRHRCEDVVVLLDVGTKLRSFRRHRLWLILGLLVDLNIAAGRSCSDGQTGRFPAQTLRHAVVHILDEALAGAFGHWACRLLHFQQVMRNREYLVPHELLETNLVMFRVDRRQLGDLGTCESRLEEGFGLLAAVPELEEVNYRDVEDLSAVRTLKHVSLQDQKLLGGKL